MLVASDKSDLDNFVWPDFDDIFWRMYRQHPEFNYRGWDGIFEKSNNYFLLNR